MLSARYKIELNPSTTVHFVSNSGSMLPNPHELYAETPKVLTLFCPKDLFHRIQYRMQKVSEIAKGIRDHNIAIL